MSPALVPVSAGQSPPCFAKEGAKIVGADFNPAEGQKTIDAINAAGGEATFVETNLRVKADVDKLYNVVMEKYGTLTTLANCAGVLVHKHFLDHNDDDYDFISETNMARLHLDHAEVPALMTKENSHGKNAIVNIASISSIKPETDAYYYGAFKGRHRPDDPHLTREFSPKGVRLKRHLPRPRHHGHDPQGSAGEPRDPGGYVQERLLHRPSGQARGHRPMPPPICAPTRRPGSPAPTSSSTAAPA